MRDNNITSPSEQPGIFHFGPGQFHRAHQAVYINELAKLDKAAGWKICDCGFFDNDLHIQTEMLEQDFKYTHIQKSSTGYQSEKISSIIDYVHGREQAKKAIEILSGENIKIVSLTITLNGYDIVEKNENPSKYSIVGNDLNIFDLIIRALENRKNSNIAPFTILSCDNLAKNGEVTQKTVIEYCRKYNPALAEWIHGNVSFPNTMVDRITPAHSGADCEYVQNELGYKDAIPVSSEPFTQWIIEDNFCNGRPELEAVGVTLVDDVEAFELMKIRALNATHQVVSFAGILLGYDYVHDAMNDALIKQFVKAFLYNESHYALRGVRDTLDVEAYYESVMERFANSELKDTITRLCSDSSVRIPKLLQPIINGASESPEKCRIASSIVAFWYYQISNHGFNDLVDPNKDVIERGLVIENPVDFIKEMPFLHELVKNQTFMKHFEDTLEALNKTGAKATITGLCK